MYRTVGAGTDAGALQAPALYRGAGDGSFTDVTNAAGLLDDRRATFGTTVCDLDDDGLPEHEMAAGGAAGSHPALCTPVARLQGLPVAPPLVICNEAHRFLVAEQLAKR